MCMCEGETGLSKSVPQVHGWAAVCEPPGHNTHAVCVPAHSTEEPLSELSYRLRQTVHDNLHLPKQAKTRADL